MAEEKGRVCVTGGTGFLGSWLVSILLSKGYIVHATVRDPSDKEKCAHLYTLDRASENLKLFKAELLDYDGLYSAIQSCSGVFHVATPVPSTTSQNPEIEVIEPAVKGTLNVLKACTAAKVRRAVVVSSGSAMTMNPGWSQGQVLDESCWSSPEYCRETKNWYMLSKTVAEREAVEYGERTGFDVITLCPTLILGPVLQSNVNASCKILIRLLKDGSESMENRAWSAVDVRDLAEALVLVYEKPDAEGRYACSAHQTSAQTMAEKLKSIYPQYNYPKNFTEGKKGMTISSQKLQRLGWSFRPLEETLVETVESFRKAGILD